MQHRTLSRIAVILCILCILLTGVTTASAKTDDGWPYIIRNGSRESKQIAITVDDCFDHKAMKEIYQLCVQYQVCVTFFPLGNQIKKKEADFWREMAASPYVEIGSHTQNHTKWTHMHRDGIALHLRRMQQSLDEVLGYHYETKVVRPPYGATYSKRIGEADTRYVVEKYGYKHLILWDVSQTNPNKAIKQVKNGSILLYHARKKDLNCLKKLIPMLLKQGYEPVTVSQLLGFGPVATSTDLPDTYVRQ